MQKKLIEKDLIFERRNILAEYRHKHIEKIGKIAKNNLKEPKFNKDQPFDRK